MNNLTCINLTAVSIKEPKAYLLYRQAGEDRVFALTDGDVTEQAQRQTNFGPASYTEIRAAGSGLTGSLMLHRGEDGRFALLNARIHNGTGGDIFLKKLVLAEGCADFAPQWLVTPLVRADPVVCVEEADYDTVYVDAAGIYPAEGDGVVVGPVGRGSAYGEVHVGAGKLQVACDLEGVLLENGESRDGEQMLILCGDSRYCVSRWAKECARQLGARTHREAVDGWCSWYDRTTKISEEHVNNVVNVYASHRNRFHPQVIQIDDGYQVCDGDWRANERFPSGMKQVARNIRNAGFMPGKWMAPLMLSPHLPELEQLKPALRGSCGSAEYVQPNPFHPDGSYWLEPTHPIARKFIAGVIRQAVEDGYEYIKLDFNAVDAESRYDKKATSLQVMRSMYALYRENAGQSTYILSCIGKPTRGVVGYNDASRIGPDSHPGGLMLSIRHTLRFQYLHKVWFNNDPDVSYIAASQPGRYLSDVTGGENMVKTWHSAVALTGGTAMISEPIQEASAEKNWRMIDIMTPPCQEKTVLYDLCRTRDMGRFGFTARRSYGDFATVMLWNDHENETLTRCIDLDTLELAGRTMAVYSFWDNTFRGFREGGYETGALPFQACEHLRITPVTGKFAVIGSNLHLSCGAAEIADLVVQEQKAELMLTDAGARDGSIFVYVPGTVTGVTAEGMEAELVSVQENVYELRVQNRIRGREQKIILTLA